MKAVRRAFLVAAITAVSLAAAGRADAQEPVSALRAPFQQIVDDFNANSLDRFVDAVDHDGILERIYEERVIDGRIKDEFSKAFAGSVEDMFTSAFPRIEAEILAKVIAFRGDNQRATAIVRYDLPRYQFIYHEFQLRAGNREPVLIEDWVDFNRGERFTQSLADSLVMAVPNDTATRSLMSPVTLSDDETFQAAELLKAARDGRADRYFEILPNLDPRIQEQRLVALTSAHLAQQLRDRQKYRAALNRLADNYATDPLFSMMLLDYYLPRREHQAALEALLRLGNRMGVQDAALKSQLATLSLIVGNSDEASEYAEAAVADEPGLELAWWAALRARTAEERYDAAIEALRVLEEEFGHKLRSTALQGDSLLAQLLDTEEFKAWAEPAGETPE